MNWPSQMRRNKQLVRIHFDGNDLSIEGILMQTTDRHYILANAHHIASADTSFPLDGHAWIPRERVLYLQEL